ncbi:hypothetical protein GXS59_001368 [Salmonella enterica]|uniref:PPM-type phosphatase domain-containing protein n=1 Tax=Salmonella enterica TaxID=28901 RepID=A0A5Z2M5Z0_SALER|nr:hypothetical protein [Salmonella enterica]EHQ7553578.1 hypothetical protein [Salmonella enterica subsp. enterica]EAO0885635.1 hypothetical protein [Salmonella enterica]EAT0314825.1 hypothetical protein [Salmonella enterica]EBC3768641.1 hypothetical protein [Salmonella enterica]EBF9123348.1 hypothetical protein [Salmonella enterica]
MFTERLARWLARSSAKSGINRPEDLNAVLSTDIGLVRAENQDLIAAIRVNTPSNVGNPFFAMALLDGMGGMQDGKQCATIALSTLFYSLIKFRSDPPESRLLKATLEANSVVYDYAKGHGGSTLSAVIIENGSAPVIVNVGDSRIYSFSLDCGLTAISSDDSLEALGGRGRGLLQFIGMGESIKPHINILDKNHKNIILTSDGTHFISHSAFEELLSHSSDFSTSAQRIAQYVQWCGAKDNASFGIINCNDIENSLNSHKDIGVELWNPHGNLHIMWMKNYPAAQNYFSQNIVDDQDKEPSPIIDDDGFENKKTLNNPSTKNLELDSETPQRELFSNESPEKSQDPSITSKAIKQRKNKDKKKAIEKIKKDQSVMINIKDEENKNED